MTESLLFNNFAQSPVAGTLKIVVEWTPDDNFYIFAGKFVLVAGWFDVTLKFVAESVTSQFLTESLLEEAGGV